MPPSIDFAINIWDTSHSPLCAPGDKRGWRWSVSVWKEGWASRRVHAQGCEDTLAEACFKAQQAVASYGVQN